MCVFLFCDMIWCGVCSTVGVLELISAGLVQGKVYLHGVSLSQTRTDHASCAVIGGLLISVELASSIIGGRGLIPTPENS